MVEVEPGCDVALAVGKVRAYDRAEISVAAVARGSGVRRLAEVADRGLDVAVVVVMPVLADLAIQLQSLKVLLQDEVDHTGDRVRAVYRRCAASDDLDAFDHEERNLIEVRSRTLYCGLRRAHTQPPAVNQDQRPVRTQTAQVGRGDATSACQAAGTVAEVLAEIVVEDLRELIEHIADVASTRSLNALGIDDLDGTRTCLVRRGNARAGDHYLLDVRGGGSRGQRLGESRYADRRG